MPVVLPADAAEFVEAFAREAGCETHGTGEGPVKLSERVDDARVDLFAVIVNVLFYGVIDDALLAAHVVSFRYG